MSLLDGLRRRFARAPEPVRAAVQAAGDPDEDVLAWGTLVRDEGWLVATSRGLRVVGPAGEESAALLPWHRVGHARWAATADGGSFTVTPLEEVEPGVQARMPARRHALADPGELPTVVRRRVDETVVDSRRHPLPGRGSVLLVARRLPGQAAREWTVVFDQEADRADQGAREEARRRLAEVLDAERPD
ncbi:MAG: hypothetical protein AVDCRST_MAG52-3600 [uncultured Blastococcus sp.]|uniref:Uncharacterized protein n=1 Tax=uncultured Blastococcus sp. TaxID=217144 RepID=A0A6J4JG28_9ACTN|nr:MAG: hypothetical protein AVDCRST_MAG52-3600 [uncultured Blastococcus sp.]